MENLTLQQFLDDCEISQELYMLKKDLFDLAYKQELEIIKQNTIKTIQNNSNTKLNKQLKQTK